MAYNIVSLNNLIIQFEKLPGIGKKTAQRLAFFVLSQDESYAAAFAEALVTSKQKIHYCRCCQSFTDLELCDICSAASRDKSTICVVESPKDVLALERTREYNGLYHVLHGALSPIDNIGPEQLKLKELMARLSDNTVKEVIMATNPTVEGEATASYIARLLKPMGIKITRLAYGVPVGSDLEFADEITLSRAIDGRNEI